MKGLEIQTLPAQWASCVIKPKDTADAQRIADQFGTGYGLSVRSEKDTVILEVFPELARAGYQDAIRSLIGKGHEVRFD